ncbi:MAG: TlpA disulfide reductase family protein [Prevotella sp.]|nr:TlpA disulfide reductase family protein [Prevotella sp.]
MTTNNFYAMRGERLLIATTKKTATAMHRLLLLVLLVLTGSYTAWAQHDGFRLHGCLPLPDGTAVGLLVSTDTAQSVECCSGVLRNHTFSFTGKIDRPRAATFITNNLNIVAKNHWPDDSIHWNYINLYLTNDDILITPELKVKGGQVQDDYNDLLAMDDTGGAVVSPDLFFRFIDGHPHSPVAVDLARRLMERAYNLTAAQVEHLDTTITSVPEDTTGLRLMRQQIAQARKMVKGATLQDLDLVTTKGMPTSLSKIVAEAQKAKPGYVLIDFWASWCGICLAAMPDIKTLAEKYSQNLTVLGVSIDIKEQAWLRSMQKHHEPWAQYRTSPQGYKDLFTKYQVGNGVPYYLLVRPDGKVLSAMSGPEQVKGTLDNLLAK